MADVNNVEHTVGRDDSPTGAFPDLPKRQELFQSEPAGARLDRIEQRFDRTAESVLGDQQGLLNMGRVFSGYLKRDIDGLREARRRRAREADGRDAEQPGTFDGRENVGRLATGADRDRDVPWTTKRLDLACEDPVEPEVVGDGSQGRAVGREGNRRQRGSVTLEATDELRGEVLSIGGAASVAEEQQLLARAKALFDHKHSLGEPADIESECSDGLRELRREQAVHVGSVNHRSGLS
jgi:hypothetical protein